MSSIGTRITPNAMATLRRRSTPERLPCDTMDRMARSQGWEVVRTTDERGYPLSEYRRGPWVLAVGWTIKGGHGVRANLYNRATHQREQPRRDNWVQADQLDAVRRSQDIFRWVGHALHKDELR